MAAPLSAPLAHSSEATRDAWLPSYVDILRRWVADGRVARLPLSGVSMEPTILPGARVFMEGCEPGTIRVADVVVYEDASGLICHRVLGHRSSPGGRELLTKGDRLRVPPAWVSATSVVGRVVEIETGASRRRLTRPRERLRAYLAVGCSWLVLLGLALRRVRHARPA